MSWTWQGRQLTKAVKDKTVTFTYDSEGIRTGKSDGTNTTKYLLKKCTGSYGRFATAAKYIDPRKE